MIVTAVSRDNLILNNIVQTLQQMKQGGQTNIRLALDHIADAVTVDFYVDQARTQLLFSETSDGFDTLTAEQFAVLTEDELFVLNETTGSFVIDNTRTYYTPPDALVNDAPTLSTTISQPFYYVTATFSDGTVLTPVYRNVDNLVFQSVIVASKEKPEFTTTENTAIVVPRAQKTEIKANNTDIIYVIPNYEIYIQLNVFNWAQLSEQQRVSQSLVVDNLIRNALYADTSRGNNCTFFSKDLYETNVDSLKLLPSTDLLKAMVKVSCCYMTSGSTN